MMSASVLAICIACASSATLRREQKQQETPRIGSDFNGYGSEYFGSEFDLSGTGFSGVAIGRSDLRGSDFNSYGSDYFGSEFDLSGSGFSGVAIGLSDFSGSYFNSYHDFGSELDLS